MRQELKKINGKRSTFTAVVVREGLKRFRHHETKTLLLRDIRDGQGNLVADHLWFNLTKGFEDACLDPGDMVCFDARVKPYTKGYKGRRDCGCGVAQLDYKLSNPTNIEWIESPPIS